MNKHPHEEVILAYYRGEQIEFRPDSCSLWNTFIYNEGRAPSFRPDHQYRIKPEAVFPIELTQNEVEALWAVFAVPNHAVNVNEALKSIRRKLNRLVNS